MGTSPPPLPCRDIIVRTTTCNGFVSDDVSKLIENFTDDIHPDSPSVTPAETVEAVALLSVRLQNLSQISRPNADSRPGKAPKPCKSPPPTAETVKPRHVTRSMVADKEPRKTPVSPKRGRSLPSTPGTPQRKPAPHVVPSGLNIFSATDRVQDISDYPNIKPHRQPRVSIKLGHVYVPQHISERAHYPHDNKWTEKKEEDVNTAEVPEFARILEDFIIRCRRKPSNVNFDSGQYYNFLLPAIPEKNFYRAIRPLADIHPFPPAKHTAKKGSELAFVEYAVKTWNALLPILTNMGTVPYLYNNAQASFSPQPPLNPAALTRPRQWTDDDVELFRFLFLRPLTILGDTLEKKWTFTKKEAYIVKMAYNAVRKQFRVIADQLHRSMGDVIEFYYLIFKMSRTYVNWHWAEKHYLVGKILDDTAFDPASPEVQAGVEPNPASTEPKTRTHYSQYFRTMIDLLDHNKVYPPEMTRVYWGGWKLPGCTRRMKFARPQREVLNWYRNHYSATSRELDDSLVALNIRRCPQLSEVGSMVPITPVLLSEDFEHLKDQEEFEQEIKDLAIEAGAILDSDQISHSVYTSRSDACRDLPSRRSSSCSARDPSRFFQVFTFTSDKQDEDSDEY